MTTIYIVRHGQSEGNANYDAGLSDTFEPTELGSYLTDLGKTQAKKRSEEFKDIHFDGVFSSDFHRAKQTAEVIMLEKKIAVQATKIIRERFFGGIERIDEATKEKLQNELRKLNDEQKMDFKHGDTMESASEAATRMITFLRETAIAYSGKIVLVVSHGNIMRAFLTKIGWAKYDELPSKSIENTGYIVLESDGVDFFIKETNGVHKQLGRQRIF